MISLLALISASFAPLKNGQRPAKALRAAQMWMLKQTRWKAPYYWAGFTAQGEWK